MNFAERLAELMNANGFSNYRLAKLLDCSQTTVANWIKDITEPAPATKRRIANVFKVSVEYLNGETDIKKAPAENDERSEVQELFNQAEPWLQDQVLALLRAGVRHHEAPGTDPKAK